MAAIDKVRVLVVGDSGVGKTSLVHLISYNEPLLSPSWTVGCSVEVKLHEYKEATSSQNPFFIELYDVGGSISHQNTRSVFYSPTNGLILVHDLTNVKSAQNLKLWLCEILNKEGKDSTKGFNNISESDFDPEQFLGSTQIPILVIGTKLDLMEKTRKSRHNTISFAEEIGADEICLNCHEKNLAAGTSDAVKLSRFFDKVIERKFYSRENSGIYDKKKFNTPFTSPLVTPFTSPIGSFSTTYYSS